VGHAAALRYGNKVLAFIGTGGAGKTTISTALQLSETKMHSITDNYLLLSDVSVIPFYDPFYLEEKPFQPQSLSGIFQPVFHTRKRHYFLPSRICGETKIKELVMVLLGRMGAERLRLWEISPAQALSAFYSTTLKLGQEFPHGSYTAYLPYLGERPSSLCLGPRLPIKRAYFLVLPSITSLQEAQAIAREVIANVF